MSGTLVDLVDVCTTHAIVEEGQDLREQCARDLLCGIQPQVAVDKTGPGLAARPTSGAARRFVDIERIAPFCASREADRNCSTGSGRRSIAKMVPHSAAVDSAFRSPARSESGLRLERSIVSLHLVRSRRKFADQTDERRRPDRLRNERHTLWKVTRPRGGLPGDDQHLELWPALLDEPGELKSIQRA